MKYSPDASRAAEAALSKAYDAWRRGDKKTAQDMIVDYERHWTRKRRKDLN